MESISHFFTVSLTLDLAYGLLYEIYYLIILCPELQATLKGTCFTLFGNCLGAL